MKKSLLVLFSGTLTLVEIQLSIKNSIKYKPNLNLNLFYELQSIARK